MTHRPSVDAAAWAEARRVLCVRLDNLGDLLMTGPAIRALKAAVPGRRVTLLTSPAAAAAARLLPGCDSVITFGAPWVEGPRGTPGGDAERRLAARLAGRFDAAAIFTVNTQSPLPTALLLYMAGVPRRLAHSREHPHQLLTDWVPESEPGHATRHEVRRQLDLVAAAGAHTDDDRLALRLPRAARAKAAALLEGAGLDRTRPWVLLHPGASAPTRRYPPELYARAADTLAREHGVQILVVGGPADEELVGRVRSAMDAPSHGLTTRLDLAEFAALVASAPVLVCNNSGPAHIAAAVGTGVVDLYALTNPQHAPWRVPHRLLFRDVPCRFCLSSTCPQGHHLCLRGVPPAAVVRATLELLHLAPPTPWPELPTPAPVDKVPQQRGGAVHAG